MTSERLILTSLDGEECHAFHGEHEEKSCKAWKRIEILEERGSGHELACV